MAWNQVRSSLGRALILGFGMVCAGAAHAQWILIASTAVYEIYGDRLSIERRGHQASSIYLYDFRQVQSPERGAFRSSKLLREFDCHARNARMVSISEYMDPMGRGPQVNSFYTDLPWEPVKSGGALDAQWQFACNDDPVHRN